MGNIQSVFTRHLLMACGLSAVVCLSVQAAGNGEIVLNRTVQPHAVGNPPMRPDPYPTTVNTNPSSNITSATTNSELGDGDFARVSTGTSLNRSSLSADNHLPALNNTNGLPGMTAGHGGGSGGTISNQINRSIEQGMRPLTNMGGGQ